MPLLHLGPDEPGYPRVGDSSTLPASETQQAAGDRLEECWDLLLEIAMSPRPLAGGFRERAGELLLAHGVIDRLPCEEEL